MEKPEPASLEISAKTVDEAVEIALKELNLSREQVKVEVLKEGKKGLWGLGTESARVRVTAQLEGPNLEAVAVEVCHQLLRFMGIKAQVTAVDPPPTVTTPVSLDIRTDDSGILIGRRGETLAALQFIINLMVGRRLHGEAGVSLDVEGYRHRHYESLQNMALRVAERVTATGRPVTLEPMPARERRVIHLALADRPDVSTQSTGEGDARRVEIRPKQ
ncbi:MAG: protein jag [Chloroflexi bacterium]|nr:protein jag [Chloroflexota bacterium]